MKLLVLVLNQPDKLNKLLHEFNDHEIRGATILESTGMAHTLMSDDDHLFGSWRRFLDPNRKESKTIYMVLEDEKIIKVLEIIEFVIGSLNKPDTGIVFTVPVDFVKGINKSDN
ncbi:MAG: hypothetical protein WC278_01605 [Bacilli bacterium]|jgi:nitrogen regulatory protein PII|nr:hypothetical protein [Bacilli bacterium]MDD2682146.1 hypothetical protein [Bacilli bacterium]MDD3121748.1 hypothetical protein [Bacilli bacterium]MDD4063676.1 hypothetical protein [Bacilli bacterium]MDD4482540.1 hypothetical protein [Bacilli bacterium]